jgi:hypothetical protein
MRARIAWAIAFFTLVAIVNSFPLILHPGTSIGQHGDSYFSVWRLAWVAHQLRADPWHLFDGNIFHPQRDTLAYSDAMLLPAIVVAPFNWMGVSPLVVYNLTLFAAFVASAVTAFLLVRELTGSTPAALVGGTIFAFSAHRLDHFDHLELQFAFWIPLGVLYWHRAVTRDRGYLIVGLLAAGQILSSIYHGIFFAAWLAVATSLWFVRTPLRALRAAVLILWLPTVTLAVYSLPYMKSRAEVGDRPMSDVVGYSARPMDFLSAPANNVLYGWTDALASNERHLFPGIVATLLLVVGLWPPLDRTRAVHAAALAFALLLTLGVNGPIYRLLYDWVLPFRGLRVPARADILVLLGTSVLAGFGLTRLMRAMTSQRMAAMAAVAAVTLASVECLARPTLIEANPTASVWYAWLRTVPDAVVFEWPVTVPWRLYDMRDVRYMYRSTLHWRPMLNGYSGHYPESYVKLLYTMRDFPYTQALIDLRRRGATVLILHDVEGSRPSYDQALQRLVRDPNIRLIAEDMDAGRRVIFLRLLPAASASEARAPRRE